MAHHIVRWSSLALAAAALYGCADTPAGPMSDDSDTVVVRAAGLPGLRVSASRGLTSPTPAAFVAVTPGSIVQGSALAVRKATGGAAIRVSLVDGGLDPLAVPALPGDELLVDVLDGSTVLTGASVLALPALPPIVIRTDPPRRRTSVPVNVMLTIVFSEPIAPASVTSATVRLRAAGDDVPATLTLQDEGTVVLVRPLAPLRYSTDHTLEITTGIEDLSGDPLAEPEFVTFETEPCIPADTTPFAVRLLPDSMTLPVGSGSGFVVLVDSGARLINHFPDTSLTWASTDTTIVRPLNGAIDAVGIGEAYVIVEYGGDVDSALVRVTQSPPPGPFAIFPGGAVLPIGFTFQFAVSYPEGTEAPIVTWSSTDPSIFVVDDTGLVTALAAGIAHLVAVAGQDADTAVIEVYDPSPPLADLFVVTPESLLLQVGDVRQLSVSGASWPPPPVTWWSSDAMVATVDDQGALRAEASGRVIVGATYGDGSADSAYVEVVAAGSLGYITLTPAAVAAAVGDTVRFTLNYDATAQANYGGENVGWGTSSPNVQVLRYLSGGVFEVLAAGTAEVSAYVGPLIARATVTASP